MIKKLIGILAFVGAAIFFGAIPSTASAQCVPATQYVTGPAQVVFDPTVANGTVLWTGNLNVGASSSNCIGGTATITYTGIGAREDTYYTYQTSVAGVGIRLKFITQSCNNNVWFPIVCSANWTPSTIVAHSITVELVKTGTVTAGGALTGIFSVWNTNLAASPVWAYYAWASPVLIQPSVPTCAVSTPLISVPLGNVSVKEFSGVGTPSSTTRAFNIALQCSGAVNGAYTNVYTTLTDQTNPANVSDTLALSAGSTASGVGIQVLNGAALVKYGPDSSAAGNMNQWWAGTATNGTFNIALTARYVQTSPTVTPGSANGRATFTMSYQ